MRLRNALVFGLATHASAWLPKDNMDKLLSNDTIRARWLPDTPKIRGVNLGSLFIIEPWMARDAWNAMGCRDHESEFDCMRALGQARGNAAFQSHWDWWITQDDIRQIASLGLNTIRIPVGYWMREDIVYRDSEWFPQGGFPFLERVCKWAAELGLYIIIDLHGEQYLLKMRSNIANVVSRCARCPGCKKCVYWTDSFPGSFHKHMHYTDLG
jgi:hypothetical protein